MANVDGLQTRASDVERATLQPSPNPLASADELAPEPVARRDDALHLSKGDTRGLDDRASVTGDIVGGAGWECPAGRWWLCALLGAVLIGAGVFVLYNAVLASVISAIFFAAAMIVAGALQIVHAFSARGWGSFAWSVGIGLLFGLGGVLMLTNPLVTSIGLTIGFVALLATTGIMRLVLAYRHWSEYGWVLLASGIFGIATAAIVMLGFPWSGLLVPGVLLGLDLVLHGAWWLAMGLFIRRPGRSTRGDDPRAEPLTT